MNKQIFQCGLRLNIWHVNFYLTAGFNAEAWNFIIFYFRNVIINLKNRVANISFVDILTRIQFYDIEKIVE